MTSSRVDLTVLDRDGRPFVDFAGSEYALIQPRSVDKQFWNQIGSGFARSLERQMAMYGVSVGEGKKIAGEYVLSTRLAPITSLGMPAGYTCVSVSLLNDTLSQPQPIMFASSDLDSILSTLRARADHQEGLTGPRGSVFVLGETETRGTWPLRQTVLHARHWMVLGAKNDVEHLLQEQVKAGWKSIKLALDVYNMSQKFPR